MWGLFRRAAPLSPGDDVKAALLDAARAVLSADFRFPNASDPLRRAFITNALGSLMVALRRCQPGFPIEDDSPAMVIVAGDLAPGEGLEAVKADLWYVVQQLRGAQESDGLLLAVMMAVLAPRWTRARLAHYGVEVTDAFVR